MNLKEQFNKQVNLITEQVHKRLNMQQYLAKYEADYADEFDVYGLAVLTEEDKNYFDNLPEQQYCHSFGSNDAIEYETKAELLSNYTWTELYKEEAELVIKLIGKYYGKFYYPEVELKPDDYDPDVKED